MIMTGRAGRMVTLAAEPSPSGWSWAWPGIHAAPATLIDLSHDLKGPAHQEPPA
jgi:hypothetical protein